MERASDNLAVSVEAMEHLGREDEDTDIVYAWIEPRVIRLPLVLGCLQTRPPLAAGNQRSHIVRDQPDHHEVIQMSG